MTEPQKRMIDTSFAQCGVCGEENDNGFGYSPGGFAKIMWVCSECMPIAKDVYGAPQMQKKMFTEDAIKYGATKAGEYLEKIGKTDCSTITAEEWFEMFRIAERERALELRRLMASLCPPF